MATEKHALVFGASGVSGWGVVNQLTTYPTPTTWASITGTTNRQLSPSDAFLPEDSRISLVSGIDLTKSAPEVAQIMKAKIPNIGKITHVFFTAYVHMNERTFQILQDSYSHLAEGAVEPPTPHTPDWHKMVRELNIGIVQNATGALNEIAPNMRFFVMQTGGKHYGMDSGPQVVPGLLNPPYEESRPRLTGKAAEPVFYYGQCDAVAAANKGQSWTWCEARPDVIVGFVPSLGSVSGQDAARLLGLYLSLYRKVHGEGSEVPFPGTQKSWTNVHTDSFQDTIGKVSIWAAINDHGDGTAFNCVDKPTTWKEKWETICAFFNLKGTGPGDKAWGMMDVMTWVQQNKEARDQLIKESGLIGDSWENANWIFLFAILVVIDYDREYDMKKAQGLGFADQSQGAHGWIETFKRLRTAKIIP